MYTAKLYSITDQNFKYEITFLDTSIKLLFDKINKNQKIINNKKEFRISLDSVQDIIFLKCKEVYCKIKFENGTKKILFSNASIIQIEENYILKCSFSKFVN